MQSGSDHPTVLRTSLPGPWTACAPSGPMARATKLPRTVCSTRDAALPPPPPPPPLPPALPLPCSSMPWPEDLTPAHGAAQCRTRGGPLTHLKVYLFQASRKRCRGLRDHARHCCAAPRRPRAPRTQLAANHGAKRARTHTPLAHAAATPPWKVPLPTSRGRCVALRYHTDSPGRHPGTPCTTGHLRLP